MQSPAPKLKKIIKAGAGAGKTTTLVNELFQFFVQFKEQNKKVPKIIVTTFTKKATQELKERLLKKAIEENSEEFFSYINNKSLIFISTIHGVLNLFLKQNTEAFGFKKNIEILTENEEELLFEKNLRQIFVAHEELSELLQFYSIQELYHFCLDYQEMIRTESDYQFYSEAEFQTVIQNTMDQVIKDLDQSTAGLAQEKLTKSWEAWVQSYRVQRGSSTQGYQWLVDWEDSQESTKPRKGKEENEPLYSLQVQFLGAVEKLRDYADRGYLVENALLDFNKKMSLLKNLGDHFLKLSSSVKQKNSQISLRDIEFLTVEELEKNKEIYFQFSSEWDFWMIDEYQDTSPLQEKILQVLIGDSSNFLVGDPQQSIYLFRGARSEIFQEKFQVYQKTGHSHTLVKNYRSSAGVLHFINDFFTSEFRQFQAMEVTKSASSLDCDIQYVEYSTEVELSDAVALEIQNLIRKNVALDEIVVLSRTNKELIDLEKKLKQIGIPYFYHSSGNFYKKREVLDVLMFIKFLYNPFDDLNLISLLRSPWIGFSEDEILKVKKSSFKNESFIAALSRYIQDVRTERLSFYLQQFAREGLMETLKRFLFEGGLLLTSCYQDETGQRESNIWKLLTWINDLNSDPYRDILEEVNSLLSASYVDMEMASESSAIIEPKRVQLMTVHASKGLQFKHVLLLSADKRPRASTVKTFAKDEKRRQWSFLIKNPMDDSNVYSPLAQEQKQIQSERESDEFWRLLYVALTRAKEQIIIFSNEKPESSSWAFRLRQYLQRVSSSVAQDSAPGAAHSLGLVVSSSSVAENRFKCQFLKITPEHVKNLASARVLKNEKSTLLFDPQILFSKAKGTEKELQEAISYTSSHKYFDLRKTISGVLKKESGVELHFDYEKSDKHLSLLKRMNSQIPWTEILRSGHKEFGFSYLFQDKTYTGSIDLWGQCDGKVYLVDYKTGDKVDSQSHFDQLKFYAQSLMYLKLISSPEVQLVICYMGLGKTVEKSYLVQDMSSYLSSLGSY